MGASESVYLNPWVVAAFKTPVLLGGYWDDYPRTENAFVVLSVIQAALALSFFLYIIHYAFTRDLLDGDWTIKLVPDQFSLSFSLVVPLLTCAWELVLAGMHLGLVYAWFSAPSMAMVYIHSQLEWYLVLVRIAMLYHSETGCCRLNVIKNFTLASLIFTAVTLIAFMTTSSPNIQGGLAGIAFGTDFTLFLLTPILACKSYELRHNIPTKEAQRSEILVTILSLVHIFQYYPPIFMVAAQNTFTMRQQAGIWLTVWGFINLFVYLIYISYASLGLRIAIHQQIRQPFSLLHSN